MSANTFTEAVELAYAEAWRLGDIASEWSDGKRRTGRPERQQEAVEEAWRESLGAQKVLGVLLHARGEVGLRSAPMTPDVEVPDIQQVWIRLVQWGIRKGFDTQASIDEVVENSPQYEEAMRMLGKDRLASGSDVARVRELAAGAPPNA